MIDPLLGLHMSDEKELRIDPKHYRKLRSSALKDLTAASYHLRGLHKITQRFFKFSLKTVNTKEIETEKKKLRGHLLALRLLLSEDPNKTFSLLREQGLLRPYFHNEIFIRPDVGSLAMLVIARTSGSRNPVSPAGRWQPLPKADPIEHILDIFERFSGISWVVFEFKERHQTAMRVLKECQKFIRQWTSKSPNFRHARERLKHLVQQRSPQLEEWHEEYYFKGRPILMADKILKMFEAAYKGRGNWQSLPSGWRAATCAERRLFTEVRRAILAAGGPENLFEIRKFSTRKRPAAVRINPSYLMSSITPMLKFQGPT